MMWLAETPSCVVQACWAMLPRLEAEEAIARANEVLVGTTPQGDRAQELGEQWNRSAAPPRAAAAATRPDPAVLTQLGFKVNRIPTKRRAP